MESIAVQALSHDEADNWHCRIGDKRFGIFEGYRNIIAVEPHFPSTGAEVYELKLKQKSPKGVTYITTPMGDTASDEFDGKFGNWHYEKDGRLLEMFAGLEDVIAVGPPGNDGKRFVLRVGEVKRNPDYMQGNLLHLQVLPLPQEDDLSPGFPNLCR